MSAEDSKINLDVLRLRYQNPQVEAVVRGLLISGPDDREDAMAIAAMARAAIPSPTFDLWARLWDKSHIANMVKRVKAPTLFLHPAEDQFIPISSGHSLARRMRNARVIGIPVDSPLQVWRDAGALNKMIAFVLQGFGLRPPKQPVRRKRQRRGQWPHGLTDREVEVLRIVAVGLKDREIGERLHITRDTVSHHLRNIFKKASVTNRTEAAAFAHRHGLSRLDK